MSNIIPSGMEELTAAEAQALCDDLHFEKNRPELPKVKGRTMTFPPYTYQPFPCALYRAGGETKLAMDEGQKAVYLGQGWAESPADAERLAKQAEEDRSTAHAERNYGDARMSDVAKREAAAIVATTEDFVPEIPVAPKKRGRPRKAEAHP